MMRRSTVLLAAMLTLFIEGRAAAEAGLPPTCSSQLLPSGEEVPANLPGIVIAADGSPVDFEAVAGQGGLEFTDGTIALDPVESSNPLELVVAPHSALAEDTTYSVSYTIGCDDNRAHSGSFKTGPSVALPTTIGTATKTPEGKIEITPTDELLAFMSTTRFSVSVDGVKNDVPSRYGAVSVGSFLVSNLENQLVLGNAESYFATGTQCPDGGLVKHAISLSAHVAGTTTDPAPLAFDLDFDCTPVPDGGAAPEDAGTGGGSSDDGGCNVSEGGNAQSVALLFGASFLVGVVLRRRRR